MTTTARDPLTLDALLASLRAQGIAVGTRELARLHDAFAALRVPIAMRDQRPSTQAARVEIDHSESKLRALLRATLAKTTEERTRFEAAFTDWLGHAAHALATPDPADEGNPEPNQRANQSPHAAARATEQAIAEHVGATQSPALRRRRVLLVTLAIICLAGLTAWGINRAPPPAPPTDKVEQPTAPDPRPEGEPIGTPGPLAAEFVTSIPLPFLTARQSSPLPPPPSTAQLLGLASLAFVVATVTWLTFQRRAKHQLTELDPKAARAFRAPSIGAPPTTEELLDRSAARAMVYGVDRFVAEEPNERIDVPRTVAASARAGLPIILHELPRYERSVWIWRDTLPVDPAIPRLSREVERRLARAGIEVKCGSFYASPDTITWDDGGTVTASAVDGHRESTILLLLTDGEGLDNARKDATREPTLRQTLHGLRAWPRLAMVCFGGETTPARDVARRYGLTAIQPEALPRFLADREIRPARDTLPRELPPLQGALKFWAASLALVPQPFDDSVAFALRRALGSPCDPWDIEALFAAAQLHANRYRWSNDSKPPRLDLLDWLAIAENHHRPDFAVASHTHLARALRFWRERLRLQHEALERGEFAEPAEAATKRRDQRRAVDLELALLALFDQPVHAAAQLEQLARSGLASAVHSRLREFVPGDCAPHRGDHTYARLPWQRGDVAHEVLASLADLGLGEGSLERKPARPPATTVGVMAASTLLLLAAITRLSTNLDGESTRAPAAILPAAMPTGYQILGPAYDLDLEAGESDTFTLRSPNHQSTQKVAHSRSLVTLEVGTDGYRNPEVVDDNLSIWRTGRRAAPGRPRIADWPTPNILWLVLPEKVDRSAWQTRAHALLDAGAFDAVVIAAQPPRRNGWPASLPGPWPRGKPAGARPWQLVIAGPEASGTDIEPDHLAVVVANGPEQLSTPSVSPGAIAEVWPGVKLNLTRGNPRLASAPVALDLVAVPRGTFRLGSPKGEDGHSDNEGPIENVTVGPFAISRYEVARRVWRLVMKREPAEWRRQTPADDDLPANDVSWFDAVEFCNALSRAEGLPECYVLTRESVDGEARVVDVSWNRAANGYRLPTEAEWEYAARAGTTTRYPWGNDEAGLDANAWWDQNAKKTEHAAGLKQPNAWGLHDVIGNVWEWCWDEYANTADPQGRDGAARAGSARVLRGGPFFAGGSRNLRSACRDGVEPTGTGVAFGFRCVRAAHPQR